MHRTYKAYYDTSGSQSDPNVEVLTSLGALSNEYQWGRFEAEWEGLLKDANVPYFHMVEYVHRKPGSPFESWTDEKRNWFMERALPLINRHTTKVFCVSVLQHAFDEVNRELHVAEVSGAGHPRSGAFAMVSGICRTRIEEWIKEKKPKCPLHHVFEHGDHGKGALEKQLGILAADGECLDYSFLSKHDKRTGIRIRQFEAVDLLAWEVRKYAKQYYIEGGGMKMRRSVYEIINTFPIEAYGLDTEGLRSFLRERLPAQSLEKIRR